MQQQTLLALLLLALTTLAAVGGGMKPREPFAEHDDEEVHMNDEGESAEGVSAEEEPTEEEPAEEVSADNGDVSADNFSSVEGFTGNMYAGF